MHTRTLGCSSFRRGGRRLCLLTVTAMAVLGTRPGVASECSNADFSGRYAVQVETSLIGGHVGNWGAGTLYADGKGVITEWKMTDVFVSPATGEKVVRSGDRVAEAHGLVTYEVEPDCRITIRFVGANRPPDDRDVELRGGLANGGKEVLATIVAPKPPTGGYVMKSIDSSEKEVFAEIRHLLRQLAIRNGLIP